MVCGSDVWTGIYRDPEGFTLKACGEWDCVHGYDFVRTAEEWIVARDPHHRNQNLKQHNAAIDRKNLSHPRPTL